MFPISWTAERGRWPGRSSRSPSEDQHPPSRPGAHSDNDAVHHVDGRIQSS
jgi:hypothetical protein